MADEQTCGKGLADNAVVPGALAAVAGRLAGSYHGVRLDPPQLIAAAHAAGRPAAERTTLYEIRAEHPVAAAA